MQDRKSRIVIFGIKKIACHYLDTSWAEGDGGALQN